MDTNVIPIVRRNQRTGRQPNVIAILGAHCRRLEVRLNDGRSTTEIDTRAHARLNRAVLRIVAIQSRRIAALEKVATHRSPTRPAA